MFFFLFLFILLKIKKKRKKNRQRTGDPSTTRVLLPCSTSAGFFFSMAPCSYRILGDNVGPFFPRPFSRVPASPPFRAAPVCAKHGERRGKVAPKDTDSQRAHRMEGHVAPSPKIHERLRAYTKCHVATQRRISKRRFRSIFFFEINIFYRAVQPWRETKGPGRIMRWAPKRHPGAAPDQAPWLAAPHTQ